MKRFNWSKLFLFFNKLFNVTNPYLLLICIVLSLIEFFCGGCKHTLFVALGYLIGLGWFLDYRTANRMADLYKEKCRLLESNVESLEKNIKALEKKPNVVIKPSVYFVSDGDKL